MRKRIIVFLLLMGSMQASAQYGWWNYVHKPDARFGTAEEAGADVCTFLVPSPPFENVSLAYVIIGNNPWEYAPVCGYDHGGVHYEDLNEVVRYQCPDEHPLITDPYNLAYGQCEGEDEPPLPTECRMDLAFPVEADEEGRDAILGGGTMCKPMGDVNCELRLKGGFGPGVDVGGGVTYRGVLVPTGAECPGTGDLPVGGDGLEPTNLPPGTSDETPINTTESSEPTDTQPDTPGPGDTTTTETTTTTTSGGRGTTTSSGTDTHTIRSSEGTKVTKTTTTTTTTYADGTSTVTRDVTYEQDPSTTTTTTIDWSNGGEPEVTHTDDSEPGRSGSSTTITNYGSDGSVVGTSTTSEGDCVGPDCGPGDEVYAPGERGQFDGAAIDGEIESAREALGALVGAIQAEAGNYFDFTGGGGSGLPCYSFAALGTSYQICLDPYYGYFVMIGNAILLIAFVLGIFIILR
jgi:hypothetical protein